MRNNSIQRSAWIIGFFLIWIFTPCWALLTAEEAFDTKIINHQDKIEVQWNIAPGYQLDANSLALSQNQAMIKTKPSQVIDGHYWVKNAAVELSQFNPSLPLHLSYQGCKGDEACYPPQKVNLLSHSIGITLISFFAGGMLMAFSPCAWPMAPILLTLIQPNKKQGGHSILPCSLYGLGVLLALALVGAMATSLGASLSYWIHQPVVTLLFVTVLIQLAYYSSQESMPSWVPSYSPTLHHLRNQTYYPILLGASSLLIASPCMTPGLAAAISFATRSSLVAGISSFLALGLGLILPLFILAISGERLLKKVDWIQFYATRLIALGLVVVAIITLAPQFNNATLLALISLALISLTIWKNLPATHRFILILLTLLLGYQADQHLMPQKSSTDLVHTIPEKNMVIFFTADWCQACKPIKKQLKQSHLSAQVIIEDTTIPKKEQQQLMEHYGIAMPPSMIWIDEQSHSHRYQGSQEIQQLLEELSQ